MDESRKLFVLSVLEEYADIPEAEWRKLADRLESLTLEKNGFFVRQGDLPDRMGVIFNGIFRVFCITESGDEKILSFRMKGQFLSAYSPFVENRESWYSIQALTDAELICVPLEDMKKLSDPCWEKVVKEYMVRLFIEKEDRERSFLTEDARTRYERFRESYPELEEILPQYYIAEYLGISPVSLSRIRGEIKKNDH
ncbi:MAG: Crp/Fnr family transcriptional regulator [Deltaproteobacteria bacterium]|nr:Crp/Fnr family transcriptional regulator [Candidatus Zymogenaceae bacterium]